MKDTWGRKTMVSARFDEVEMAVLETIALKLGVSKSEVLRRAVAQLSVEKGETGDGKTTTYTVVQEGPNHKKSATYTVDQESASRKSGPNVGLNCHTNGPIMGPNCHTNGPKLSYKWAQRGPKLSYKWAQTVIQNGTKMGPLGQTPRPPYLSSKYLNTSVCKNLYLPLRKNPQPASPPAVTHTHTLDDVETDPNTKKILDELSRSPAAKRMGLATVRAAEALFAAAMSSGRPDYAVNAVAQALAEIDILEGGEGQLTRPAAVRMLRSFVSNARRPRAAPEPAAETLWREKRADERRNWKTSYNRREAEQSAKAWEESKAGALPGQRAAEAATNVLQLLKQRSA